jgi:hypothetical protein
VEELRPEADASVKKVWDEVETFYNEETITSKRRKAREWGVVYVSDVELAFNFTVKDSATTNPIANVVCELVDTGTTRNSAADGTIQITSTITGSATFSFSHPDYVTSEITIEIPDGETVFTQDVTLVHV